MYTISVIEYGDVEENRERYEKVGCISIEINQWIACIMRSFSSFFDFYPTTRPRGSHITTIFTAYTLLESRDL